MPTTEPSDAERFEPGFGTGGVPWYLLLFYLTFLVFFTWYVLEYQLPEYLDERAAADSAEAQPVDDR